MKKFQQLSETEMEVMQVIWDAGRPVTSAELLAIFAEQKKREWKGQTISTFLARLVEKGVLEASQQKGRTKQYLPRVTPEEYRRNEARGILDLMYKGSVKNFLAALYEGESSSKQELEELKSWFAGK